MERPQVFVLGARVKRAPESLRPTHRGLALDVAIALMMVLLFASLRWVASTPSPKWALIFLGALVAIHLLPRLTRNAGLTDYLMQRRAIRWPMLVVPVGLLIFSLSLRLTAFNPLWTQATELVLARSAPEISATNDPTRWAVQAFYYSIASWPTRYLNRPVFYGLPYEKGPPKRFIGRILARWDLPETSVTIEGPKTTVDPIALIEQGANPRERLRECLIPSSVFLTWRPRCLTLRRQLLTRHIEALSSIKPSAWTLNWFDVQSPTERRTQGIRLRAENAVRVIERWTVITPGGTHQTFAISTGKNASGEMALATFQKVISSMSVDDDLKTGRAWADQRLGTIKLSQIHRMADTQAAIQTIAEVHAILLSRLSVDPKALDAYYHLAGSAVLLLRKLQRDPKASAADRVELGAAVKPLVESIQRYAQDIAPGDKRTTELVGLWKEIRPL